MARQIEALVGDQLEALEKADARHPRKILTPRRSRDGAD
jgi:hypothetical protein